MASSADIYLRAFILDYLNKRGMTAAAEGMRRDQIQETDQPPHVLSPDSGDNFLSNWFTMYWEVFTASISARLKEGGIHPNPQVVQIAHQVQSQQQAHPSQHLQHQQPPQDPSAQQNQHPSPSPDPNNPIQQSQVQNTAQMFSFVDVDTPIAHATTPSAQAQNRLMSANMAQNPQNMFAARTAMNQARGRAHQQQKQGQQQVAANMFNYPIRNAQGSMQQMQNQQRQNAIRQQQPQAMLQSTQRTQQNASGTPRLRNASADNRHALPQGQLHSLALDPTIQGQKTALSAEQIAAAAAMSRDMLDARMPLEFEGIFSSVGTRTSPSRNSGAAATSVSGRARMQQFPGGVQTPQAAIGSNGLPLRANGGKTRSFSGLQAAGSEAPSTASRRGSMDVSVDGRPYEDAAVVDESQPRVGGNGTSTSGKRRAANQSVSRKSSGAGQSDDNASRRGSLGPGSESAGPAKRQRSAGAYQRNAAASPTVQMQKQIAGVDLDSLTPQNGMQAHPASANHIQALALQQSTQPYRQNANRMNNAQFLSQLSPENVITRGGNRYAGRANASPNPPPYPQNEQSQSNRQREVFMHGQLSSGRRTPMSNANSSTTNAGKGADARPQSRNSKGNDTNVPMPQGLQGGMQFPVSRLPGDSPLSHLEMSGMAYISNDDLPVGYRSNAIFPGLGNNGQQPKKVVQGSQQDGSMGKNVALDQQTGTGTDIQQVDVQMSAQLGRKESNATMRARQSFRKASSGMQVSKQDMATGNEKKGKSETNLNGIDKQNGFRGELKRTGSSRAMKTIETTGVNRVVTHPDGTNRSNGLGTSAGSLPQTGMNASLPSSVTKRDRITADADLENRSTKSDRQASGTRGSGTQSQKSTASGASGAVEGRQATSSSGTKRGRGRSRARGGSGGRRSRAERVPPRGGNGSRGNAGGQGSRNNVQEQKNAVAGNRQRNVEAPRASQSDQDRISSMMLSTHGNTTAQENRSQPPKVDRVGRVGTKHGDEADLQRAPKLPFDLGENNATAESRGPDVASDQQLPLMEMYGGGRTSGDINQNANDKAFQVQPLNFMGVGDGKIGGQGNSNFPYDLSPYMSGGGVEGAGLGEMLPTMTDNIELMAPPDLEDESILGGVDPGDLTITGRSRS